MDSGFNINSLTNFAPCCFVLQAETAGGAKFEGGFVWVIREVF